MIEFTVKRSEWLRDTGEISKLVIPYRDKTEIKRCCLGFYGNQVCGLTDEDMENIGTPAYVRQASNKWGDLIRKGDNMSGNSHIAIALMGINDNEKIDDTTRELGIGYLFSLIGVFVTFVD